MFIERREISNLSAPKYEKLAYINECQELFEEKKING